MRVVRNPARAAFYGSLLVGLSVSLLSARTSIHPREPDELQPLSLLDSREQPIAPTRTHEGPHLGDRALLAAFDGTSACALDHAVLERKFHGHGRVIGAAFVPGFRQIAS